MPHGIIIDGLTGRVKEADDRLVLRCAWEVARGRKRLLVIYDDTYTVVMFLRVITDWRERGLLELWVVFGSGEHRRHLPLHILAARLGPSLCRVLVKVHVLTGEDALSKIGTTHAIFACESEKFLIYSAESHDFNDELAEKVEEYLVCV